MTLFVQILLVLAGIAVGAILCEWRLGRPAFGALAGAALAGIALFVVGRMPSAVLAVETFPEFDEKVLRSGRPVLVDFYSDRCPPCRKLMPVIKEIAEDYEGRVDVIKVDCREAPAIARYYGVRAVPAVLLFVNGRATHRWVGLRSSGEYRTVLDSVLANRASAARVPQ